MANDLSAEEFATRQKAEDALVALGPPATPKLQRLLETASDEEVRSRLQSAIKRIADQTRIGPTLITLQLKDASAKDAFDAVSAQLPAPLKVQGEHVFQGVTDKVTLDCVNEPFWSVMLKLTEQTGIGFTSGQGNNELSVIGVRTPPPHQISGAFLVRAESAQRTYSIQYANGNATSSDFNMVFSVWPDPKMQVAAGPTARSVRITRAEDDQGREMLDNQGVAGGWRTSSAINFTIRLRTKNADAKKLAILTGSVFVPINLSFATVRHDKLTEETEQKVSDMRVRILPVVKVNDRRYQIKITLYRDGASDELWTLVNHSIFSTVRVEDSEGRVLDRAEWGSNSVDGIALEGTVNFNRPTRGAEEPGEPAKLIWTIPIESREIEVPFEFRDLPLPG